MVAARLAPGRVLARAAAVLRLADAPRRPASASGSPPSARAAWPTCRSLVEESLSVSRHPARQDDGPRAPSSPTRFSARVGRAGRPRGPLAHGRPLADGVGADELRDHAGARLLVRRAEHRPRRRTRSRSARSSPSPRCRRACCSRSSRCCHVGVDIQTLAARCSTRIFEYLDLPVDIAERPDAGRARPRRARRGALRGRRLPLRRRTRAPTLERRRHRRPAGHARRARRRDRRGQDDARLPRRAAVRRRARAA